MTKFTYTPEITDEIIQLYNSGTSTAEIAEIFDIPEKSVVSKLAKLKIYKRKRYLDKLGNVPEKKEQFVERLALIMNVEAATVESLAKVNKSVLKYIEKFFETKYNL